MNWTLSDWTVGRILKGKAKKFLRLGDDGRHWVSFNGLKIEPTGKVSLLWNGHAVASIHPVEWNPRAGDTLTITCTVDDNLRGEVSFRIVL